MNLIVHKTNNGIYFVYPLIILGFYFLSYPINAQIKISSNYRSKKVFFNPNVVYNLSINEPGLGIDLNYENSDVINFGITSSYFLGINDFKELFIGPYFDVKLINPKKKLTNYLKIEKLNSFKVSLRGSIQYNRWLNKNLWDLNPFLGVYISKKINKINHFCSFERNLTYEEYWFRFGIKLNFLEYKSRNNECF